MGEDTTISSYFEVYDQDQINALISYRDGETKLGERISLAADGNLHETLRNSTARFVLIGIPEDIGVRANGGVGGAHTLWEPALKALLNIQSTTSFTGEELMILGAFNFEDWMDEAAGVDTGTLRELVARIDGEVYPLISLIVAAGKMPIVIGGGHNNAYPILKGASKALARSINCINLDAHSDYRVLEGRHSGNGFRYARTEGYLDKYAIVGLHRNYNSQSIIDTLSADPGMHFSYFDDILHQEQPSFREAVVHAIDHTKQAPTGIELDMDCIAGVLSSAATPSGINSSQARQYLHWCGQDTQVAYLHLTEGAVALRDGRKDVSTAKLAAYLISDFVRGAAI